DDPDAFAFDPLYGYTELLDENDTPVVTPGAYGRLVSTGLLFPGMPFIRHDTGDSARLAALPDATNGHRLMVRGITPKHGTSDEPVRRPYRHQEDHLQSAGNGLRYSRISILPGHTRRSRRPSCSASQRCG